MNTPIDTLIKAVLHVYESKLEDCVEGTKEYEATSWMIGLTEKAKVEYNLLYEMYRLVKEEDDDSFE